MGICCLFDNYLHKSCLIIEILAQSYQSHVKSASGKEYILRLVSQDSGDRG